MVIGQIIFGYICDRTAYTRVMFVSSVGAALSGYLLWGYAHDTARLFTFVAIFGGLVSHFLGCTLTFPRFLIVFV